MNHCRHSPLVKGCRGLQPLTSPTQRASALPTELIRQLLFPTEGNLGVKGAVSLREVGEERAGSGIPKVAKTGRNKNPCVIFCNRSERHKEVEPQQKGQKLGVQGMGSWKFRLPTPQGVLHLLVASIQAKVSCNLKTD